MLGLSQYGVFPCSDSSLIFVTLFLLDSMDSLISVRLLMRAMSQLEDIGEFDWVMKFGGAMAIRCFSLLQLLMDSFWG